MRMNVVGKMTGASEEAGVRRSGEFGGDIRGVPQEPDFAAGANRDGTGFYGNAHGAFKLIESHGKPVFPGGYHHKVPGLIGGDQDGQTQLSEGPGEAIRMSATDVTEFLDRFRGGSAHVLDQSGLNRQTAMVLTSPSFQTGD